MDSASKCGPVCQLFVRFSVRRITDALSVDFARRFMRENIERADAALGDFVERAEGEIPVPLNVARVDAVFAAEAYFAEEVEAWVRPEERGAERRKGELCGGLEISTLLFHNSTVEFLDELEGRTDGVFERGSLLTRDFGEVLWTNEESKFIRMDDDNAEYFMTLRNVEAGNVLNDAGVLFNKENFSAAVERFLYQTAWVKSVAIDMECDFVDE